MGQVNFGIPFLRKSSANEVAQLVGIEIRDDTQWKYVGKTGSQKIDHCRIVGTLVKTLGIMRIQPGQIAQQQTKNARRQRQRHVLEKKENLKAVGLHCF